MIELDYIYFQEWHVKKCMIVAAKKPATGICFVYTNVTQTIVALVQNGRSLNDYYNEIHE